VFQDISVDNPPHTGWVSNIGRHLLFPTLHPACLSQERYMKTSSPSSPYQTNEQT